MQRSLTLVGHGTIALFAGCILLACTGCGSHLGLIDYWRRGILPVDAKFPGLEGKRVAVVCLDGNSLHGPGSEADTIARAVTTTLGAKVADIRIVRQSEIADWIDSQNEDLSDYRDVGRGVKADMVVGIDLISFNLHEGQTLLKGRAKVGVKVFDMTKGGQVVYESPPKEITWPESGARHVTENEDNFRNVFIYTILADKIARDFYAYEAISDVAIDAQSLAN
ncbi:MAG TPA: hypothetical protein VFV87_12075 [Pirellulaceae bacterium]|nr:hypothetical protein [Pirellulaceae bacterium]